MDESGRGQHRFQSFWYGDALFPHELFRLKSFVASGHAVDLYSYDPVLAVRRRVRVRDAGELLGRTKCSSIRPRASEGVAISVFETSSGRSCRWKGAVGGSIPTSCASPGTS